MKKIFTLCLALMLILGLCACVPQETIDGRNYEVLDGNFIVIEEYEYDTYLVADKDTNVIYILETFGHGGFLSPHLIYKDGAIYGAVWIDEDIVPVPFAIN